MAAAGPLLPVRDHTHHSQAAQGSVHDPVCGMSVDPALAAHRAEHDGRSYFFCSARCREQFTAEPARYLTPAAAAPPTAAEDAHWTCPMHPQIIRAGPGSCPICGMALEPMVPAAGDAANPELRGMTRRFWVGVALSLPLLAMGMADHVAKPALDMLIAPRSVVWLQLILATPVVLVGRLAVFPARLELAPQPPAQHVHPDRARHRCGLPLQPRRSTGAGHLPALVPHARRRRSHSTSRRLR